MRLYEITRGSYSDRQHRIWWGPDDAALGEAQVLDAVREACPWNPEWEGRDEMWGVFWDEEAEGQAFVTALRRMGWTPAVLTGVCIDDVPPTDAEKARKR